MLLLSRTAILVRRPHRSRSRCQKHAGLTIVFVLSSHEQPSFASSHDLSSSFSVFLLERNKIKLFFGSLCRRLPLTLITGGVSTHCGATAYRHCKTVVASPSVCICVATVLCDEIKEESRIQKKRQEPLVVCVCFPRDLIRLCLTYVRPHQNRTSGQQRWNPNKKSSVYDEGNER